MHKYKVGDFVRVLPMSKVPKDLRKRMDAATLYRHDEYLAYRREWGTSCKYVITRLHGTSELTEVGDLLSYVSIEIADGFVPSADIRKSGSLYEYELALWGASVKEDDAADGIDVASLLKEI